MPRIEVPFFKPSIGIDEVSAVSEALTSGWLTTGPKVREFEKLFSDKFGHPASYSISVNSATAGLHLALEAGGVAPGETVILPTMTFTATAEVVTYLGAKVRLIDSEPNHPNMDLNLLHGIPKSDYAAVIPVHFGGVPLDTKLLRQIIGPNKLIIEDAAHAIGAKINQSPIGSLQDSDSCVFSFYANKNITTGEGGLILVNNADAAKRVRSMATHGFDRSAHDRFKGQRVNSWEYDIIAAGFKYNLTDIAAALGIHQFYKLEQFRTARKRAVDYYLEALAGQPLTVLNHYLPGVESAFHLFTIDLNDEVSSSRDSIIESLRLAGIACSVHYKPLHLMSYWRDLLKLNREDFPNATRRFERTISLPLFPDISEQQLDYVVQTLIPLLTS